MLRRVVLPIVIAVTVITTALAMPASAKPAQVKPPWVKASSSTSITLDWYAASGAQRYQVFYSTSYAGAGSLKARSKYTSGRQTQLKITGLKPGTMYCFAVRAVGSGNGARAPRHCKFTMRRENDTSQPIVRVATFNICSNSSSPAYCKPFWGSRVDAVVERIKATDAEVVALQEASSKFDIVANAVAQEGLLVASHHGSEAILYDPDVLEPVMVPGDGDQMVADEGTYHLRNSADAAWARLRHKASGNIYMFVSTHLTNGKSGSADVQRKIETRILLQKLYDEKFATHRIVIAGDFNSNRNRSNDVPRKELNAKGWFDVYDRSATFRNPRFNSFTGWSTSPTTSNTYGDHVDRIFVKDTVGSTTWRVEQQFASGRYTSPVPSDHSPVRATLYIR